MSLSTNGRVWTEGQKHIHQAAAISRQTQSVRLSWLQGCSPGSLQMSVSKRQQMSGEWHTGENSLFPACPCCQPTGHTQERSPSPNTVGKGCQHCRAECLEVWRCLSKGCLCSLSSSTPEALYVCPEGQDGSCSLNKLLFLHLLHAVLVLLVPFLYFLGGTSNPDLETKLSMSFMVLSLTLVVYKLLRVGSRLQNPGNPNQAGIIDLTLQISRHRYLHTF